jgi:hypothetical protein
MVFHLTCTLQAHILNLLKAKLGSYKDFHTMLYTCSAEFDFLPVEYRHKLTETLLIPVVGICFLAIAVHAVRTLYNYFTTPKQSDATQTITGKHSHKHDKNKKEVRLQVSNFYMPVTKLIFSTKV